MLKSLLRKFNSDVVFPRRYRFLTHELAPFLGAATSVLDVGTSNGKLLACLAKEVPGLRTAGVDVHVQEDRVGDIREYDGHTLPYPDASFDCVMFVDVLHHTADPVRLLQEARRVSRKHVLIKDHYYDNAFDFFVLKWADYFGNDPFGIVLPYKYLNAAAWLNAFKATGLTVLSSNYFWKPSFDPCKHVVYHLGR